MLLREVVDNPAIAIVGAGAVTRVAAPLLNNAAVERPSWFRKLIGDAARYGDQLLRRIPIMPLRSLEPVELEATLTMPHRLVVVDMSRRVLAAVSRDCPRAECHCIDITFQALPLTADVVIAFNVICRLQEPAAGMAHVAAAVRPGGWLLIDDRSAAAYLKPFSQFTPGAPKIHRRHLKAGGHAEAES